MRKICWIAIIVVQVPVDGPEITPYLDTFHAVIHFVTGNIFEEFYSDYLSTW